MTDFYVPEDLLRTDEEEQFSTWLKDREQERPEVYGNPFEMPAPGPTASRGQTVSMGYGGEQFPPAPDPLTAPPEPANLAPPPSMPSPVPQPEIQTTIMQRTQGRVEAPNQFAMGLSTEDAYAACGPAAAMAFAQRMGRNPTAQEALDLAKQVGWTRQGGMNGPQNQKRLLDQMGVPSVLENRVDWGKIREDVQRGNPVIVSTPLHYFVASDYNPETGKYFFGNTGTALRSGSQWMSPEEVARISPPQAVLYLDNPDSPAPSVALNSPQQGRGQTDQIRAAAQRYGVDADIFAKQLYQESKYDTNARNSTSGARGIAQFMPATGNAIAQQLGVTPDQFWANPALQIEGAALHMSDLLRKYNGDYRLALSAYNAGPGNVDKYQGVPPFKETQDYLAKILGNTVAPAFNNVVQNVAAGGQAVVDAARQGITDPFADYLGQTQKRIDEQMGKLLPHIQQNAPELLNQMYQSVQMAPGPIGGGLAAGNLLENTGRAARQGLEAVLPGLTEGSEAVRREYGPLGSLSGMDIIEGLLLDPSNLIPSGEAAKFTPELMAAARKLPLDEILMDMSRVKQAGQMTLLSPGQLRQAEEWAPDPTFRTLDPHTQAVKITESTMNSVDALGGKGGATFNLNNGDMLGTDAWAVGSGGAKPTFWYDDAEKNVQAIESFIRKNAEELHRDDRAVGTWVETMPDGSKQVYYDLVNLIPEDNVAFATAVGNKERAIFHLGAMEEVPVWDRISNEIKEGTAEIDRITREAFTDTPETIAAFIKGSRVNPYKEAAEGLGFGSGTSEELAQIHAWAPKDDPNAPKWQRAFEGGGPTSIPELIEWAKAGEGFRDWYPEVAAYFKDRLGEQATPGVLRMLTMLSAPTAAATPPEQNFRAAAAIYRGFREYERELGRPMKGQSDYKGFESYMRGIKDEARLSGEYTLGSQKKGQTPMGHKLSLTDKMIADAYSMLTEGEKIYGSQKLWYYGKQLLGAAFDNFESPIVFDRWMARALGFKETDAMTDPRAVGYGQAVIEEVAKQLGWRPDQVQAAVWFTYRSRELAGQAAETAVGKATRAGGKKGRVVPDAEDLERIRAEANQSYLNTAMAPGASGSPEAIARHADDQMERLVADLEQYGLDNEGLRRFPTGMRIGTEFGPDYPYDSPRLIQKRSRDIREPAPEGSKQKGRIIEEGDLTEKTVTEGPTLAYSGFPIANPVSGAAAGAIEGSVEQATTGEELSPQDRATRIGLGALLGAGVGSRGVIKRLAAQAPSGGFSNEMMDAAAAQVEKNYGAPAAFNFVQEAHKLRSAGVPDAALDSFARRAAAKGAGTSEEWFKALRYNSMLSAPGSVQLQVIGNMTELPWKLLRDSIRNVREPHTVMSEIQGAAAGFKQGLSAAAAVLEHGVRTGREFEGQGRLGDLPGIAGKIGTALDVPSRSFAAVDELFMTIAHGAELGRLAGEKASREGLRGNAWGQRVADIMTGTEPDLVVKAQEAAERLAFKGDMGRLGSALSEVQSVPYIGNLVFPFLRTVYHILGRGIDRSPLGAIGTGIDVARGAYRNGAVPKGAAPLWERVSDNALGTLGFGLFLGAAFAGNVSGEGPKDPNERRRLERLGWQPNSIKIGDQWLQYTNLGPIAISLGSAGSIGDAVRYRKADAELGEVAAQAARNLATLPTEQAYMRGLFDLVGLISGTGDPGSAGATFLGNQIRSVIPFGSAFGAAAASRDPYERQTESVGEKVQSRIPVAREQLPAKLNAYGDETPGRTTGLEALTPFRTSKVTEGPTVDIDRELGRAGINLSEVGDELKGVQLSPDQKRQYMKVQGQLIKEIVGPMVQSFTADMPASMRAELIQKYVGYARKVAAQQVVGAGVPTQLRRQQRDAAWSRVGGAPEERGFTVPGF